MKSKKYFEGIYFKLKQDNNVIAFIPGCSETEAFVQFVDKKISYYIKFNKDKYFRKNNTIILDNNIFSPEGISVNLISKDINIKGNVSFKNLKPLSHNIMGPFQYIPMQCSHGVISMYHRVNGNICINNMPIVFNNGIGYCEEDRGTSFPKTYLWVHCNDFIDNTSIMVSIADIPLGKINFKGVICAIRYNKKEYILATYKGVKIVQYNSKNVILKQGNIVLIVDILENGGQDLLAPNEGNMSRTVRENISCKGKFTFYINNKLIFEYFSNNVSYEYVE